MDEDTARWVRVEAAKACRSVSRWVGEILAERRRIEADLAWEASRDERIKAGEAFLASPARNLGFNGRAPKREEIYDEMLRRHERAGVREGHVEFVENNSGNGVDDGDA
jgi:hypothetical protein